MNINKFIFNYFSSKNVDKQLKTLFIFTILIPILLVGSIIYFFSYRQIVQNYEYLSEAKAMQVRSVLVTMTIELHEMYENLSNDLKLRNLLSQKFENSKQAQQNIIEYNGFKNQLENSATINDIKLYVSQDFLKQNTGYNYFYPITEQIKSKEWYIKACNTKSNFWISDFRISSVGVKYCELKYYCHIPIPQIGDWALLELTVSNDNLRSLIDTNDYNIYISVNSNPVFFSSDRQYLGYSFPTEIKSNSSYYSETGKIKILNNNQIASIQTLQPYATDDKIYILSSFSNALSYIHRFEIAFICTALFAIIISALLILLYSKYFSSRIQTLRLAMYKVSHNDYKIVNSIHGNDELSAAFSDLKTMVDKLKKTEAEIYQAQIDKQIFSNQQQQMELKLLANQINPHFLYNTLETIRMKAFSEGNREVANAIKLLGKSMRYVLNNTKSVATTLDKEIDYIKTYLAILKMRFGNRLNYKVIISENLNIDDCKILPLLIQPIIENAVSHGLEDTGEEGHLILKLYKKNDDLLIIKVFDNGIGMSKEKLKDVISNLNNPPQNSNHGVGLYNINSRVHLFYGSKYGLNIKSIKDFGTLVTLTVPLQDFTDKKGV